MVIYKFIPYNKDKSIQYYVYIIASTVSSWVKSSFPSWV